MPSSTSDMIQMHDNQKLTSYDHSDYAWVINRNISEKIHTLILGPQNCGKSVLLEENLKQITPRIYIGTLWRNSYQCNVIIDQHQVRRGGGWLLVECTGLILQDFSRLDEIACIHSGNRCVALFDGLTTLAVHVYREEGTPLLQAAQHIGDRLRSLLKNSHGVTWWLVDRPGWDWKLSGLSQHAQAAEIIHLAISGQVEIKTWPNI